MALPVTQKAKGILALADCWLGNPLTTLFLGDPLEISLAKRQEEIRLPSVPQTVPLIGRPCPKRPRHGFEESIPIRTWGDAADLLHRARKHDPEAELIIQPMVRALFSAIVTGNSIAMGVGHDGATDGKGSFSIPMNGIEMSMLPLKAAEITGSPFAEVVYGRLGYGPKLKLSRVVQLRDGPAVPRTRDFVPDNIIVKRVVFPKGTLLEWEEETSGFKPGTVVYHKGGNLSSHWAVHCLLNGIPYLTTRSPLVGEVLKPTKANTEPFDLEEVKRGIGMGTALLGFTTDSMVRDSALLGSFVVLHNAPALRGPAARLIGAAATVLLRFGLTACLGEYRHLEESDGGNPDLAGKNRDKVYKSSFKDLKWSVGMIPAMQEAFWELPWANTSIGGWSWGACMNATVQLLKGMQDFLANPSEAGVIGIIAKMNAFVNQAHNNGWWLNKFVEEEHFNSASNNDLSIILKALPFFWKIMRKGRNYPKALEILTQNPAQETENPWEGVTTLRQKVVLTMNGEAAGMSWITPDGKQLYMRGESFLRTISQDTLQGVSNVWEVQHKALTDPRLDLSEEFKGTLQELIAHIKHHKGILLPEAVECKWREPQCLKVGEHILITGVLHPPVWCPQEGRDLGYYEGNLQTRLPGLLMHKQICLKCERDIPHWHYYETGCPGCLPTKLFNLTQKLCYFTSWTFHECGSCGHFSFWHSPFVGCPHCKHSNILLCEGCKKESPAVIHYNGSFLCLPCLLKSPENKTWMQGTNPNTFMMGMARGLHGTPILQLGNPNDGFIQVVERGKGAPSSDSLVELAQPTAKGDLRGKIVDAVERTRRQIQ